MLILSPLPKKNGYVGPSLYISLSCLLERCCIAGLEVSVISFSLSPQHCVMWAGWFAVILLLIFLSPSAGCLVPLIFLFDPICFPGFLFSYILSKPPIFPIFMKKS